MAAIDRVICVIKRKVQKDDVVLAIHMDFVNTLPSERINESLANHGFPS